MISPTISFFFVSFSARITFFFLNERNGRRKKKLYLSGSQLVKRQANKEGRAIVHELPNS